MSRCEISERLRSEAPGRPGGIAPAEQAARSIKTRSQIGSARLEIATPTATS